MGPQEHPAAVRENSPCGFVVHPYAPCLGKTPDGRVCDPTESSPYGLVQVKYPNVRSFYDCSCIKRRKGCLRLHQQHAYYCQVQSQTLVTGPVWCDFVVFVEDFQR